MKINEIRKYKKTTLGLLISLSASFYTFADDIEIYQGAKSDVEESSVNIMFMLDT